MTPSQTFRAEADKRILISDGAFGTELQTRRLSEADYRGSLDLARDQRGNNDLLCLTRPELVAEITDSYAAAGAELLSTNTFNANRVSQADYGAEHLVRDINVAAARIVRKVADRRAAEDGRPRAN
jgi:5-methyltetrahydrofolate--homocysteine methyltransferase